MFPTLGLERKWKEWYPKVFGYFYKRVSSQYDVEELTAHTMNTVFMAKGVKNFSAYTWKVAHNYLVKYIHTKNVSPMLVSLDDETNSTQSLGATFAIYDEAETYISPHFSDKIDKLKMCVQKNLTKQEDIDLISLSIIQEKNSSEIAEILHIKPNTIRKRLSRLLAKLKRKCLDLWPTSHSS